jgi:ribose 5-phosphate isomerase B
LSVTKKYGKMKVAFACDHAGYDLKIKLMKYLQDAGNELTDLGCHSSQPTDYPDFGHELAKHISKKQSDFGISLCGSGNGINMTANKHPLIRSALCWNPGIAVLAREHNDANICALPARFLSFEQAKEIIEIFLSTSFEGGRHKRRIDKIPM